jgi:hypothetical protein
MAKRRTDKKTYTNSDIEALLVLIRRCDIAAVRVLIDYMTEHDLPHAARMRNHLDRMDRGIAWVSDPDVDFSRRKLTRREAIAAWRRYMWRRVRKLYGRRWLVPPLSKFV